MRHDVVATLASFGILCLLPLEKRLVVGRKLFDCLTNLAEKLVTGEERGIVVEEPGREDNWARDGVYDGVDSLNVGHAMTGFGLCILVVLPLRSTAVSMCYLLRWRGQ